MQGVLAPMHFRIFLLPIGYLETIIKYTKLFVLFECEVLMFLESINQGYSRTWCQGEHLNPNLSNRMLQKIASWRDSWFTLLTKYCYMIKLWRMRWAGHVARMGGKGSAYRFSVQKPEGRNHFEYLSTEK